MLFISKDTDIRGTKENPVFLVFPKYGNMPAQEVHLKAKTEDEAKAEVQARFGCEGRFREEAK